MSRPAFAAANRLNALLRSAEEMRAIAARLRATEPPELVIQVEALAQAIDARREEAAPASDLAGLARHEAA